MLYFNLGMPKSTFVSLMCNELIRVSSLISFESQLRLHHGGFTTYMAEFARAKTERISGEETDLLMHEVKAYTIIIFYNLFLLFLISGMFVCCCMSLYV